MRSTAAVLLALASVLVTGCVTDGATERDRAGGDVVPPTGFALGASGCVEAFMQVPVDAARVRDLVPANFTLHLDGTGKAVLGIGVASCEHVTVDGADVAQDAGVSDVVVQVESPDGTGGDHYHYVWYVSASPDVRARFAALGVPGAVVPQTSADAVESPPGVHHVAGVVPWGPDEYGYSAVGSLVTPRQPYANTKWFDGPVGLVRVRQSIDLDSLGTVAGEVRGNDGSRLARIMGATTADAAGPYGRYDYAGDVELVPR